MNWATNWSWASSLDQIWRSPTFPMWLTLAAAGFFGIIVLVTLLRAEKSVANGALTVVTLLAIAVAVAATIRGFAPVSRVASNESSSIQPVNATNPRPPGRSRGEAEDRDQGRATARRQVKADPAEASTAQEGPRRRPRRRRTKQPSSSNSRRSPPPRWRGRRQPHRRHRKGGPRRGKDVNDILSASRPASSARSEPVRGRLDRLKTDGFYVANASALVELFRSATPPERRRSKQRRSGSAASSTRRQHHPEADAAATRADHADPLRRSAWSRSTPKCSLPCSRSSSTSHSPRASSIRRSAPRSSRNVCGTTTRAGSPLPAPPRQQQGPGLHRRRLIEIVDDDEPRPHGPNGPLRHRPPARPRRGLRLRDGVRCGTATTAAGRWWRSGQEVGCNGSSISAPARRWSKGICRSAGESLRRTTCATSSSPSPTPRCPAVDPTFQHVVTTPAKQQDREHVAGRAKRSARLQAARRTRSARSWSTFFPSAAGSVRRPRGAAVGLPSRRAVVRRPSTVPLAGETTLPRLANGTRTLVAGKSVIFGGLSEERFRCLATSSPHCRHRTPGSSSVSVAATSAIYGHAGDVEVGRGRPRPLGEAATKQDITGLVGARSGGLLPAAAENDHDPFLNEDFDACAGRALGDRAGRRRQLIDKLADRITGSILDAGCDGGKRLFFTEALITSSPASTP